MNPVTALRLDRVDWRDLLTLPAARERLKIFLFEVELIQGGLL
ncbi:MAG: hypothetical protein PVF85_04795 [Anaerolineales bacterium]|jgi:hypothetical protein